MGFFVILVTVLAFIAGWLRNELALTLLGTVFLVILAYCFLGVLFLALVHRRKAASLSLVIVSETVAAGKEGELCVSCGAVQDTHRFWRLPAILIRCELCLETKDGRVIRHFADPGFEKTGSFPVRERGAYYSDLRPGEFDRLVIFDAPGFFRFSFPVRQHGSPRLLAYPSPAEELIPLSLKSGGSEQRNEAHYRKSDELTDHRPYIPGDDPRRINWKLYGHAPLGELFVREGEPEPPPHSRLLILIDTEADRDLFTVNEGRLAVDLLCEYALAAALEYSVKGINILIGYTGGGIIGGKDESGFLNNAEIASALAWPAAILRSCREPSAGARQGRSSLAVHPAAELPHAPKALSVLILALPRTSSEASALDRFLKNREARQEADVLFLYNAESRRAAEMEDAARVCVNLLNGRPGVHSGCAGVHVRKAGVYADRAPAGREKEKGNL